MTLMPDTEVTALGRPAPHGSEHWQAMRYRRPVRRFVEAGALAWMRDLDRVPPDYDWVASLEMCSLVTGQVSRWASRHRVRQAVLTWENEADQPLYRIPPYRQALRRARRADLFLCLIEAAREHLLELGVPDERIRVVLPGVDTQLFHPAEEPVAEPVLVFVSPLASNKGIDRVLAAFDVVRSQLTEARLLVLGRGPLAPMVSEAQERTRGAVTLLGHGDAGTVAATLRRGAVFVTAPRRTWKWNEQFGLAYLEAMACALPVVTTVCGTNHEAVRPPNLRVDDAVEPLSEAMLAFLSDPARRRRVGADNRRVVLERHELMAQCRAMGAAFDDVAPG
jgi:phosphatidylinositol alpha-1,6-mannosyltransferase